jgi:hypothetical protein
MVVWIFEELPLEAHLNIPSFLLPLNVSIHPSIVSSRYLLIITFTLLEHCFIVINDIDHLLLGSSIESAIKFVDVLLFIRDNILPTIHVHCCDHLVRCTLHEHYHINMGVLMDGWYVGNE